MSGNDTHRFARATLAVALLLVTLEYAVIRVFVLNFSTAGPNATALLALLLLTGWTLPVAARPAEGEPGGGLLVGLTAGGVALSLLGGAVLSLLGAALAGLALTPLLALDAARLRGRTGVAFALGLLAVLALRGVAGATPAYATTVGRFGLLALLLALAAVTTALGREADPEPVESRTHLGPLVGAVFLAVLWLGAPVTPARWAGRPYLPAVAFAALGLLAGAAWLETRGLLTPRAAGTWGLALLVSLATLLTGSVPAVVALAPALAALVVLAGTAGRGTTTPARAGLGVLAVQFAGLLAVVGFAFAVNFAFVPGGAALRGGEPAFVLGLGVVVVVAAVLAARDSVPAVERGPPDADRRTLLAGLAAGVLGVAGAVLRTPRATADPTGLRVAAYNLHQWVDADGQYNLRAVTRLLRGQDAGVVGLQETEGARVTAGHVHGVRWLAEALGYHWHPGPDTATGGYGVALLSAWPLSDVDVVELPRTDSAVRVAMRATVEHPDGAFPVVSAHLETAGDVRLAQAERVAELVADETRAVVLGDFNATPDEAPVATMTDTLTDAWAAAGDGPGDTYSANDPYQRIDYVFVRGFAVTGASVFGGPDASDHRGVRATLERT
ncbi:endonuclease/exonuclease/phosphatase family protein [Salinirubellus salinus]|uniref:Endonuclease/exonuclease/phosphatase family protein n=1 Tax=Salinirubellus salinus TaxID=1364945 RepID=A0A9E7R1M2_9EURY|nr:endonuclease/exonuclease/phosphatase family protein [Salinirubellus salinus]UWM54080.1 endonuclease/exonuclease/phosphatase family protein [Salinirubellus salinus]